MKIKDVIAQAENRFEEIIGEIPPEAAMQQYGKEFCVMCGHPTKNDKTVNELRNFFFSTYTKDLLRSVEEMVNHRKVLEKEESDTYYNDAIYGVSVALSDIIKEIK